MGKHPPHMLLGVVEFCQKMVGGFDLDLFNPILLHILY